MRDKGMTYRSGQDNKNTKKRILFINELQKWNTQYRGQLIQELKALGHSMSSFGVRDIPHGVLIIFLANLTKVQIVSANLRANLFVLFLNFRKGTIIINGLGRHRKNKFFRYLFAKLIGLQKNKNFVFQNYADFRWARRFIGGSIDWIPGSGGRKRKFGSDVSRVLVVTRDSKVRIVWDSIQLFSVENPEKKVIVVGVDYSDSSFGNRIISHGFVKQADIFLEGSSFLQPDGYGEGFPQTLADAIVSGLEVYISRSSFIMFGLSSLGFHFFPKTRSFGLLKGDENSRSKLSIELVNQQYMNVILRK